MPQELFIDNTPIGEGHPCFIIAEIGINHQGSMKMAKRLIDAAAEAGANAAKFQKRHVERVMIKEWLDKPYTGPNSFGATYGEHKIALEFSEEEFAQLKEYTESKGLSFMASAWDEESVDVLERIGISSYKMASADLINHPLLEYIAGKGKPMILSTGMATMEEVQAAVEFVQQFTPLFAILQCTSTYPSKFEELNLRVIQRYQEEFETVVGYSGHELGIAVPVAAVALGAKIVERHFTLDRTMKGTDQAASLEPGGFGRMVRDIRAIESALGDGEKRIQESERPIRVKLAKSLVSKLDIPTGATITREMLTTKGPGIGIPPAKMATVIGRKTKKNIPADSLILEEDLVEGEQAECDET
jgi:sialic acid synthase